MRTGDFRATHSGKFRRERFRDPVSALLSGHRPRHGQPLCRRDQPRFDLRSDDLPTTKTGPPPTQFNSGGANIIPTARLNPAAVNYLNAFPAPYAHGSLHQQLPRHSNRRTTSTTPSTAGSTGTPRATIWRLSASATTIRSIARHRSSRNFPQAAERAPTPPMRAATIWATPTSFRRTS